MTWICYLTDSNTTFVDVYDKAVYDRMYLQNCASDLFLQRRLHDKGGPKHSSGLKNSYLTVTSSDEAQTIPNDAEWYDMSWVQSRSTEDGYWWTYD